ncbi:MAG TPA: protoheme IX farnesyltransferase [Paludibacter sp.]|nr:protoheme IX farnesyltransferase [Paludibacter sp.]
MNYLKHFFLLIKYRIGLAVTFTSIAGYIVYNAKIDLLVLQLAIGVFVLAGGSGALNQYQDRKYDARMPRTLSRPIPKGVISPVNALVISMLLIWEGFNLLFSAFGALPALLGLFNVLWYNGMYTNLKRVTAFAVVPGALVGVVPVFIGWTAAGGSLTELAIVFIAFFIFIWQVPHFWLLMLNYASEYEAAGFPTIHQSVNPNHVVRLIYVWIVATSLSALLVPFFMENASTLFFLAIFVLNILFISIFTRLSFGESVSLKKSFVSMNMYMLLFMLVLVVFHLFPKHLLDVWF